MGVLRTSVLLFAKRLEDLATFYRSALGLELRTTADAGLLELLSGGDVVLTLHALPPAIADGISVTDPPQPRADVAIKPCFVIEDLDAARANVLASGARADQTWEWAGRRHCDCIDPEGNVFQLVSQRVG